MLKPVSRPSTSCFTNAKRLFTTTSKLSSRLDREETSGFNDPRKEPENIVSVIATVEIEFRHSLRPKEAMTLFKAPLISNSTFSINSARASPVWRRASLLLPVRVLTLAVAALTAAVICLTF